MVHTFVRRRTSWGLFLVTAMAAGCGDDPTGPVNTTSVEVRDNKFEPGSIRVSPGAVVTWTWAGSDIHDVNFVDASITDATPRSTGTYSTAMPSTAGTYAYACNFHYGMSG